MSDETGPRGGVWTIRDGLTVAGESIDRNRRELYEFGPFRLDPAERKLLRGDDQVELTPKAFDTLVLLVRNSGHLLEKEKLMAALWPDSFVEEGSLSNNIFLLRRALGDDPAFIETIPRRGYRFIGAVRQLPPTLPSRTEEPSDGLREPLHEVPMGKDQSSPIVVAVPANARRFWPMVTLIAALAVAMLAIGVVVRWQSPTRPPDRSQWVQLTKLPDSVTQPALSPDGRMLAFIRGASTFFGPGQVYVKLLPDGEPVQLTHDNVLKMSPTFSPDGSRVAYTTVDPQFHWDTWVVPTLGGEPQLLLRNASGLVWTGPRQVLFSEIKMSIHMVIVAAEESRIGARDITGLKTNRRWRIAPTRPPMGNGPWWWKWMRITTFCLAAWSP